MFLCALVGPLFPPPPAPCLLYVPFLCVCLFCCFFLFVVALHAAPARPACAPCSSPCYPCPAALRPLSRLSPLPFSFSLSTLPVRLPSLSEPRCHSCEPPACSTPVPPPRPYPFPWGLPHPSAPSVHVSHPILVALCPVWGGGGVYLRTGLWPCPRTGTAVGFLRTMSHRICRRNTENVRETLVEFPSLHWHCGAQPHRQGSHSVAPRRCPMAPVATKAWRGHPLRAGRT